MCPQGDSNPCFGLERATSWAPRRWGLKRGNSTTLPAGRHELRAVVSDDAGDPARALERVATLDLKPGAVLTVDFDRERGGILFR